MNEGFRLFPRGASTLSGSVDSLYAFLLAVSSLMTIFFVWGARVYVAMGTPPPSATEIYVVGKQWMWKIQHAQGRREINELHVPIGRPIKLIMATQDVIHSF